MVLCRMRMDIIGYTQHVLCVRQDIVVYNTMMKDFFYMKILGFFSGVVGGMDGGIKSLLFSVIIMGRRKIYKFIKNETIRCLLQSMFILISFFFVCNIFLYKCLYCFVGIGIIKCIKRKKKTFFVLLSLLRVEEIIIFRCGDDGDSSVNLFFFSIRG